MIRKSFSILLAIVSFLAVFLAFGSTASAAGTFKLKNTEVTEVSGAWRIFVTIELPKAPPMAHTPMRFLFTKTMVYERSLVDGREEPVLTRQALVNQSPMVESLDVDFADVSGKIYKGTRFDFGLKRERGFDAGEYKMQLRTSDGVDIGTSATLILKGDNPVVDRRSIAFNANDRGIKKVDNGLDGGAKGPKNEDLGPAPGSGDVVASGTAEPFVPKEGLAHTPEEDIKLQKNSGCGCSTPGAGSPRDALLFAAPLAALAFAARRRRSA